MRRRRLEDKERKAQNELVELRASNYMLHQQVATHRELLEEQSKVELEIQQATQEAQRLAAIEHCKMLTEQHATTLEERQAAHAEALSAAEHKCSEAYAQLNTLRSYLELHVTRVSSEIRAGDEESEGSTKPAEPEPQDGTLLPAPASVFPPTSADEGYPVPDAAQRVLEPESAELIARLDTFAQDLSRYVANKGQEAREAHSRQEKLRDALDAQLNAHALEMDAQRKLHQAEAVAASEKHAEHLARHIDEHDSKLQLHTEEASEASNAAARKEASLRSEHDARVAELAAQHEELKREHGDQMHHHMRTAEAEKASLEDQMRQAQARTAEEHSQHLEVKDAAHKQTLGLWHQRVDALRAEMVDVQLAANLEQEKLRGEMAALRIEHAEALRMQQRAAQAEREMLVSQQMHEKALLRNEHEEETMAREDTSNFQVSTFGQYEGFCCGSTTERAHACVRMFCYLAEGKDGSSRSRAACIFRRLESDCEWFGPKR